MEVCSAFGELSYELAGGYLNKIIWDAAQCLNQAAGSREK